MAQEPFQSLMNKYELAKKINELDGLTNEEKSELLKLLRSQKKYGLVWEDKPENAELRMVDEMPVLEEVAERAIVSDDAEAPNHILIEGDNLEALTALSYTHAGKIDVIYIDPPYNTGNKDFVYNDSFVDKENGYRHSMWLSFMNKRLKIAKNLLSEKGVIFISIDDNEQAQLKMLCDEIFGVDKFVAVIPWRKRTAKSDVPHYLSQDYEWILCYANESFAAGIQKDSRKYYETQDLPNRPWRVHDMSTQRTALERPNSNFTMVNPKNGQKFPVNPLAVWRVTKDGFPQYVKENRIVFPGDYDFLKISKPVLRYWKEDDEKKAGERFGFTTVSSYINEEVGMTQDGTKDITNIFGEKAFGFPKPLSLIRYLLKISNPHFADIVILDFFAGSGTTLHATMQLNAEDGGHRQCILATNNENGICENVTYERNRRVIQGYTTPKGEDVPGLTHNNLRYYKTKLVSRDMTTKNLRQLMRLSTDMLCIRNDAYTEKPFAGKNINKNIARYFESSDGQKRMLVIYREEAIAAIVQLIKQECEGEEENASGAGALKSANEAKLLVYVFSPNGYAYDDEFEDVADYVTLCALPDALLNAYRRVLPKRKSQLLPDAELTANESEGYIYNKVNKEGDEE